jgi:hypothetical protein
MEGSFRMIPLPFIQITVFAVPRSMARSAENIEKSPIRKISISGE